MLQKCKKKKFLKNFLTIIDILLFHIKLYFYILLYLYIIYYIYFIIVFIYYILLYQIDLYFF